MPIGKNHIHITKYSNIEIPKRRTAPRLKDSAMTVTHYISHSPIGNRFSLSFNTLSTLCVYARAAFCQRLQHRFSSSSHTKASQPPTWDHCLAVAVSSRRALMSNSASSTAWANLAAFVSSQLLKAVMAMLMCSSMGL